MFFVVVFFSLFCDMFCSNTIIQQCVKIYQIYIVTFSNNIVVHGRFIYLALLLRCHSTACTWHLWLKTHNVYTPAQVPHFTPGYGEAYVELVSFLTKMKIKSPCGIWSLDPWNLRTCLTTTQNHSLFNARRVTKNGISSSNTTNWRKIGSGLILNIQNLYNEFVFVAVSKTQRYDN